MEQEKSFMGVEQLSLRGLILGIIGSIIVTSGSMYAALKIGMVPWPTVFAAILCIAVLKLLGKTTKNEINIAQSAMTAGAMIAAGLGFTAPGLWKIDENLDMFKYFWILLGISFVGLLMGLLLTWVWRNMLLKKENLPFPIGIATAKTIESGEKIGIKTLFLVLSLLISGAFTTIRDWFMKIPSFINFKFLEKYNIQSGAYMSPLALAIGYMVGPLYTLVLFIGAVFGFVLLVPLGINFGLFSSIEAGNSVRETIGLGLMVGAGFGVIIKFIIDGIKNRKNKQKSESKFKLKNTRIGLLVCAISFAICILVGLSPIISILVLIGIFLTSLMASLITGQTGIDPLEIFGILVMITIRAIIPSISTEVALLIAGIVAIASGFVGDVMFDYKTGEIFGTNPKAQLIAQAVGGIVGAIIASFTIFIMIKAYGPVSSPSLPAVQANIVFGMISSSFDPVIFWSAAAIGASLYILKVPSTTLGIGIYLPFGMSLTIFAGGAIKFIVDKFWKKQSDNGMIVASGIFGGESLVGIIIAFIFLLTA